MLSEKKTLLLAVTALLMLPLLALGLAAPVEFVAPAASASPGCCCAEARSDCCDGGQKECPAEGCTQCAGPTGGKLVLFFETSEASELELRGETVQLPAVRATSRTIRPQVPPPDAS